MLKFRKGYQGDFFHLLILLILLLLFFWPAIFSDKVYVTTGVVKSDLMNFSYPIKNFYVAMLKEGQLPFWTDLIGNGYPLLAEGQLGALYPLNLLFFKFFSVRLAYNLFLLTHLFFAGAFTYIYIRYSLKLERTAALFSGLAFSLSGFFISHFSHPTLIAVVAYFPLQVLILEKLVVKVTLKPSLLLTFTFLLQLLAGHFEMFYHSGFILACYLFFYLVFYREKLEPTQGLLTTFIKPAIIFGLSVGLAFLLGALQILPSLELLGETSRVFGISYRSATFWLYPFYALKTFIVPWQFDFAKSLINRINTTNPGVENIWEYYSYYGLLPLSLTFLGVFLGSSLKRVRLFLISAAFVFLLVLGRETPVFYLIWRLVPGMSLFRYNTRFLFSLLFFLCLLSAIGLDMLIKFFRTKFKAPLFQVIILCAIIGLTFFDLYINSRRINPLVEEDLWLDETQVVGFLKENLGNYRYSTVGTQAVAYSTIYDISVQKKLQNLLPPNFNMLYGLSTHQSLTGLPLRRFERTSILSIHAGEAGKKEYLSLSPQSVRLLSTKGVKYLISFLPLKVSDFILAKTVNLDKEAVIKVGDLLPESDVEKKISIGSIYVYENKKVLPRAYYVAKAVFSPPGASEDEEYSFLISDSFDPYSEVLLSGDHERFKNFIGTESENHFYPAEFIDSTPHNLKLTVEAPQNGFLVLSDTFYPNWRAKVNGQPTQILRANYSFRAVPVKKGENEVEFYYYPKSFYQGLALSLFTLLLIITSVFCISRYTENQRKF